MSPLFLSGPPEFSLSGGPLPGENLTSETLTIGSGAGQLAPFTLGAA
jgi:hypothetical protein